MMMVVLVSVSLEVVLVAGVALVQSQWKQKAARGAPGSHCVPPVSQMASSLGPAHQGYPSSRSPAQGAPWLQQGAGTSQVSQQRASGPTSRAAYGAPPQHTLAQKQHQLPPNPMQPPPLQAPAAPPGSLPPGTLVQVGPYAVTVDRYLSQGGFATVYLVTSDKPLTIPKIHGGSSSETLHVLKRIVVPDKETLGEVRREVEVHKLLRSDAAVVHFLEASALALPPPQSGYEVYILMEYCSGGGLLDLLNSRLRNRLTEPEVLQIFADICLGVAAMHHLDPPVAHRDLKIENILITAPAGPSRVPTYKLCDFGSAKPILSRRAPRSLDELKRLEADLNRSTTLPYRPPEMVDVYQRRVIDEKADIWALGVLLYKLCYYTTPFEENGGGPLAILNVKYRFPSNPPYSDRIKGLIASLLVDPSTSRPSIDELIISVYKLLGKPPPASATHFASMAKRGKQAEALPKLMPDPQRRSQRALDDEVMVRISKQQPKTPMSDVTGSRLPAGIESRRFATPLHHSGPARTKQEHGPDLISFAAGPADKDDPAAKAKETQRLMKIEGIEPMRRGRPGGSTSPNRRSTASPGKLDLQAPNLRDMGDKSSSDMRSSTAPAAKSSQHHNGFADSFEPASASQSQKSAVSPLPLPQKRVPLKPEGLIAAQQRSRDSSQQGTSHSAKHLADTSAEGRFPSLEELDQTYPVTKSIVQTPVGQSPSRPSPTAATAPPPKPTQLQQDISPVLPPRQEAPSSKSSLVSLRKETFDSQLGLQGNPGSARLGSIKNKPVPPLPPQKPAIVDDHKSLDSRDRQSSDSEDDGPEDASASESIRRRLSRYQGSPAVNTTKSRTAVGGARTDPTDRPDAEKALADQHIAVSPPDPASKRESDSLQEASLIDFGDVSAGHPRSELSREVNDGDVQSRSGAGPPTTSSMRAPAWDWDGEDEETVRRLANPRPGDKYQVRGSFVDSLIDVSSPEEPPRNNRSEEGVLPGAKQSHDGDVRITSSSGTPALPSPASLPKGPAEHTDASRGATTQEGNLKGLVPSRQREEQGMVELADASTSPVVLSPQPTTRRPPSADSVASQRASVGPEVVMVGGHRAYAKGTAQSMASRWESLAGANGNPIVPRGAANAKRFSRMATKDPPSADSVPPVEARTPITVVEEETLPAAMEGPPLGPRSPSQQLSAPKTDWSEARSQTATKIVQPSPRPPPIALKPWEREEAERARVQKYGHTRESEAESPGTGHDAQQSSLAATASPPSESPLSPDEASSAAEASNGDAQTRYKSVASLIDRWQANARGSGQERGWGQIGDAAESASKSRLPGREV
ncbi:unnamed protein product [Parajaminaea phylloscopi]